MRIKARFCSLVVAAMAVGALFSVESGKQKVNLFEKRKESLARRAEMVRREGGLVEMPSTGLVFRVVNDQRRVPRMTVAACAREIENHMRFAVEVVDAEAGSGQARIEIVDDPSIPSMLVAPDEAWTRLNIAWLASDRPSEAKLAERLRKQMWRAMAYALGAGNSMYGPCLMQDIHTLADLDSDRAKTICPEPYGKITKVADRIGLQSRIRVSYKRACQEGWAPAPTNDIQRAIWEKVRSDKERGPTNPISIPPPKRK